MKEKYEDRMKDFPKALETFCLERGYHSGLHHVSSWAKCDFALLCTEVLVKHNSNFWGEKGYKEAVLNAIKVAKETLPAGKNLGVDADKMHEIISKSETPKMALDAVERELKIRPLPNTRAKLQEEIPDYAKEFVIDILFATFGLK